MHDSPIYIWNGWSLKVSFFYSYFPTVICFDQMKYIPDFYLQTQCTLDVDKIFVCTSMSMRVSDQCELKYVYEMY